MAKRASDTPKQPIFEKAAQSLVDSLLYAEENYAKETQPQDIVEWAEENFYVSQAYIKGQWVSWEKPIILSPYQKELFGIIMPKILSGEVTLVVWSEPKKGGKSTMGALVAQWWSDQMEKYNEIVFVANDREQAESRSFSMFIQSAELSPVAKYDIRRRAGNITHKDRKTIIKALPCDYKGEAGGNQGLSLWDELWAYVSESTQRLWDELTPPPTRAVAIRFVTTYAGFKGESTILWDIYDEVVGFPRIKEENRVPGTNLPVYQKGSTLVFWSHEPRQPWQTAKYYAQQRNELRLTAYVRLHENRWVQKETSLVPMTLWDECVAKGAERGVERWQPGNPLPLVIAIDASDSVDCTAMAASYNIPETGNIRLLEHGIWTPTPNDLLQGRNTVDLVETVQKRILELRDLGADIPLIVYDPHQMSTVALNLAKAGFYVRPFSQGDPRIIADTALVQYIVSGRLELYPDCRDLRDHIENAVKRESERGFRISKGGANRPCDGAVALSMSAFACTDPEFFYDRGTVKAEMF